MGPQGLWGTREIAVFITGNIQHEQRLQANLGTKWILGSNLDILLREQSKNIFGNKGDFGNFSMKHGSTDPSLGARCWIFYNILCLEDANK